MDCHYPAVGGPYDLVDTLVQVYKKLYYRLKMVELDGTATISPIESLAFKDSQAIRIYPNPSSDFIHVNFPPGLQENGRVIILNAHGVQQVLSDVPTASGTTQKIDVSA